MIHDSYANVVSLCLPVFLGADHHDTVDAKFDGSQCHVQPVEFGDKSTSRPADVWWSSSQQRAGARTKCESGTSVAMSMSAGNGSFSDPPQTLDPTDGRCTHLASCLKAASTVTKVSGSTRAIGIHPIVESATFAGNGDSYNPKCLTRTAGEKPRAVMYLNGLETGGKSG